MRRSAIIFGLLASLAPGVSRADVYGYIDEQGVARFAAEKLDDRYQLLSKGNRFGMLTLGGDGSARSALKEREQNKPPRSYRAIFQLFKELEQINDAPAESNNGTQET